MPQKQGKGITKACPFCKKVLLKNCKINGEGQLECKCPYCNKVVNVSITMDTNIQVDKNVI